MLIRRVRVSVGEADLDAMTQSFLNVSLKRVVCGNAGSGIGLRLRGITDIGNAEIHISTFKGLQVGCPLGSSAGVKVLGS